MLSFYDDWATKFLRQEKLVWSGWDQDEDKIGKDHQRFGDTPWGIRQVQTPEKQMLRLFFLSLLWRAAASSLPEFAEVSLPPNKLKKLGKMLIEHNADPISLYPITLTQLSTKGLIHNAAPMSQIKRIPGYRDDPIFRFYFDGLVAHIHRRKLKDMGPLVVGLENRLTLSTVTYDRSWEHENLMYVVAETK